ncbi:MAG: tRNA uridine-5-carboxymethylaminomethyl(34) synthesis GTPase MnmE [Bacteroidales bacterium]|nr:tRNA uridine-5-carboxymethylaminomethyl(34) synthesis GTPase MnmE [Bacteroidales bacterium]
MLEFETICALATPSGESAIAVIRLSGNRAFEIASKVFVSKMKGKTIENSPTHCAIFGQIISNGKLIDECVCTIFRSPHSYTGEDSVEFSIHGSSFIAQKVIVALLENGASLANRGEFTKRAFLNGKLDLAQAEAVCDLIQSHNEASHTLALKQLRGGYGDILYSLRQKLVDISSLLELELDFSDQDVEFADRTALITMLNDIKTRANELVNSFQMGSCFKNGIPVTIVGKPNSGKSTLLNVFLKEERAIVSDEEGTTRDTIEEKLNLRGLEFRFIDTAGIRESSNKIEKAGIERTFTAIEKSKIILFIVDVNKTTPKEAKQEIEDLKQRIDFTDKHLIVIANKIDIQKHKEKGWKEMNAIEISAKTKQNIGEIVEKMFELFDINELNDKIFVSNWRHFEALKLLLEGINSTEQGIKNNLPSDLIASDIRTCLHHLGEITGEVSTEEILGNIFSKFCIGK